MTSPIPIAAKPVQAKRRAIFDLSSDRQTIMPMNASQNATVASVTVDVQLVWKEPAQSTIHSF